MIIPLTMPQFGESITQARIIQWLKKEGESVKELEPLVEIETEKSVFAYESPFRGSLARIVAPAGDGEVSVGAEIARFEVTDEDAKKYQSLGVGITSPKSAAAPSPTERGEKTTGAKGVSPLIRSLAKEHQVPLEDLEGLQGSGPGGRVTKEDFLSFLQKKGGTSESAPRREGVQIIPLAPIRARIADNMILSKQKIPHAGCSIDVDFQRVEGWRASQSGSSKPPSYLSVAILAVLKTLKNHPALNSSLKEAEGKRWIEQYDDIHLGIAVATPQGLMVPVIHNADAKGFSEIQGEIERLVAGGRSGRLKVDDLTGATFTVNNTGAIGSTRSAQIVPYPQAAILATNRIVRKPWAVGDRIEARPIMGLDIAFDHRIIDGDMAGRFLVELKKNLEEFKGET